MNETIHVTLDKAVYSNAYKKIFFSGFRKWPIIVLESYLLCAVILKLVSGKNVVTDLFLLVVCSLLMAWVIIRAYQKSLKQGFEQTERFNGLEYDVTFYDDYLVLKTATSESSIRYNLFVNYLETESLYCLLPSKDRVIILQKNQCSKDVRDLITQHFAK